MTEPELMLSSCGLADHLTTNANLQQTNVVLSQKNYLVTCRKYIDKIALLYKFALYI